MTPNLAKGWPLPPALCLLATALLAPPGCDRPAQPPVRGRDARSEAGAPGGPGIPPDRTRGVHPASAADLPGGPRARGRAGDWIVRNDRLTAVFRSRDGRLVDLATAGGEDRFHRLDTYVTETRGRFPVLYRRLRAVRHGPGGAHALELSGRVRVYDLDLEVRTLVTAPAGAPYVTLETEVTNRDKERVLGLGVGDAVYVFNTRAFVPGEGVLRKSWSGRAQWVAQAEGDVLAALVTGEPGPMRLDLSLESAAFNPDLVARYQAVNLAAGATLRVRRHLVYLREPLAKASSIVQGLLGGPLERVALRPEPRPAGAEGLPVVEIRTAGRPVLRSPLPGPITATLPRGPSYRARLILAGAGPGEEVPLPAGSPGAPVAALSWPRFGHLRYRVVDETGRPIPVSLHLAGVAPTATPELGDDPSPGAARDGTFAAASAIYAARGEGRRLLAPGRYRVRITRGPEFALHEAEVTIAAGRETALGVTLARELATPGAVAADLHLHAAPSTDSDASLEARIVQLAAVGVEYAVATDHNHVTDYAPALPRARLPQAMITEVGVEITLRRAYYGHFNVFPMPAGSPTPPYWNRSPRELFDHAHRLPTRPVVQVNHPRMGRIGYFDQVDLDLRRGKAFAPGFETDFHAIEVFNGDWLYRPEKVERNLSEWFALLNQGLRFTATGNSDAHKLGYQEAGYPRNYLLVAPHPDDPAALGRLRAAGHRHGAGAAAGRGAPQGGPRPLLDAIRGQKVIVTSGPYPTLSVRPPGGAERLVVGETLKGPETLRLAVHAACWVPVEEVALVANGVILKTWKLPAYGPRGMSRPVPPPGAPAAPGGATRGAPISPVAAPRGRCESRRFAEAVGVAPTRDTWYVLVARARAPLPVLPGSATAVIGFTNPVWVDANGDGRFDPPGLPPPPPTR